MSKSLGNVVSPDEVIDKYGLDPIRYFLLREGGIVDDGDFSDSEVIAKLNADLADNLGNLFARITAPTINPAGVVPPCGTLTPDDNAFIEAIKALPGLPPLPSLLFLFPYLLTRVCGYTLQTVRILGRSE